jgi:hypothetical protein
MITVPLPDLFRPATSVRYPPFVHGRYLEEYVYDAMGASNAGKAPTGSGQSGPKGSGTVVAPMESLGVTWAYLPVFWTNLQNHPGWLAGRTRYQMVLDRCLAPYVSSGYRFFTVVQHDDGVGLRLPMGTVVFGCCAGEDVRLALPLVYEDTTDRLLREARLGWSEKTWLASFVGTVGTHPVRGEMVRRLEGRSDVWLSNRGVWSSVVAASDAERFVDVTRRSRFCLCPRGYGRASFRFFEAMLLDVVPVYLWDDVEWLPYRGEVNYGAFSVSCHVSELGGLVERLSAIGEEEYGAMVEEMRRVRRWFTLEGMVEWLRGCIGEVEPVEPMEHTEFQKAE